jgi:hypothetical protein
VNTQLGDYYDALHALKEQELTALAEVHAKDPTLLLYRFLESVKQIESRLPIAEPFHAGKRKEPGSPPDTDVKSTIGFVSHLRDGHTCVVRGDDALAFRYVDREIFPGRRTDDEKGAPRRSLDLLLANSHDQMPVFAELKIRGDKPAYFALIQVLMLGAEFQSKDQRARLQEKHEWGKDLRWPEEGPFADLYLIAYQPPVRGKYRESSFNATEKISRRLMKDPNFTRYIRRVAYLEARIENDAMAFDKRFAFGSL